MTYDDSVTDENFAKSLRNATRMQPVLDRLTEESNHSNELLDKAPEFYPEVKNYVHTILQRDLDSPSADECLHFIQGVCDNLNRDSPNYLTLFIAIMYGPQYHKYTGELLMAPLVDPESFMLQLPLIEEAFGQKLDHYQVLGLLDYLKSQCHIGRKLHIAVLDIDEYPTEQSWQQEIDLYIAKHDLERSDYFDSFGNFIPRTVNKVDDGPDEFTRDLRNQSQTGFLRGALEFCRRLTGS